MSSSSASFGVSPDTNGTEEKGVWEEEIIEVFIAFIAFIAIFLSLQKKGVTFNHLSKREEEEEGSTPIWYDFWRWCRF